MIRAAKISDILHILTIIKACTKYMENNDIYQWNEHYPSKEAFEKDIDRGELYILKDKGHLVGTIVISTFMDEEYRPVNWLTPNDNSVYIHRLAVHPDFQGKGFAQQMMDYAENQAKKRGFVSVRLDTFSQNKRNQKFYEARGYKKLSDIYFPEQSEYPFHCYELVV